ncbi:MAG: alpha-hydroxy acid oxidase [Thermoanaerobaculia bacterium]
MPEPVSLADFEELARHRMPSMVYEFVASGAADERTLHWNRHAYDGIRLRPRVLQDVASVDLSVTLFGQRLSSPILLAPVAYQRLIHPEGELETARGAPVTWVVSTSSTTSIEDIARVATAPLWFQLYMQSDREFTRELVARVEAAGCKALVLTVDTPTLGARNRQARAGFALPDGMPTPHLFNVDVSAAARVVVTWRDVEWLRSIARVPLLLKGILTADDAERAIAAGVEGVIVSNHGARNLDTLPATIDALPEVAERVAGRIPLLVDGGIRRGTDIVKAIALGANAVLIGRPYCYGLSVAGAAGVTRVVQLLEQELEMAMMLLGRARMSDVTRDVIWD